MAYIKYDFLYKNDDKNTAHEARNISNNVTLSDCFSLTDGARFGGSCLIHGPPLPPLPLHAECEDLSVSVDAGIEEVKSPVLRSPPVFSHSRCPPEVHKSCICVRFIAEHTKMLEDSTKVNPLK